MSEHHGEAELQKPISQYAAYLKNLLPVNIPETYKLKPRFEADANAEQIRSGIVAFRNFISVFCDRLISDGHLYVKPIPEEHGNFPFQ